MEKITISAPAKINLTLDVLGKRNDGYHLLRSVMQSIDIFDTLEISKNNLGKLSLICDVEGVPCDESNLVIKAARKFLSLHNIQSGIDFTLKKKIPSMAGMAGGSSDCAAAIIGLDRLFETKMSLPQMIEIGEKLGADVPFCLLGGTSICEGIGEKLTPLNPLSGCFFVVVKPELSISTPACFAKYDTINNPEMSDFDGMCNAINSGDIQGVAARLFNALEYAADNDEIREIKNKFLMLSADSAVMTGSGSAVYGIFNEKSAAESCLSEMRKSYKFAEICCPLNHGCKIE